MRQSNNAAALSPSADSTENDDSGAGAAPASQPAWKTATYLFLGALAMHLFFLMQLAQSPFFWVPCLDAQYHNLMAHQILDHRLPAEPFFRAPAYGYFLAGMYLVCGVDNFIAVRVIHAVLGSAGVVFLYLLGRRLFSARVGLLAGISMALYGPLIFQLSDLHTTVLEVFCLLLFALLLVHLTDERTDGKRRIYLALAAGLAVGVWASARPNAMLAVPVAIAWMPGRWREQRFVSGCLAFLAGVALFPGVLTTRNAVAGKDPVFIAWFGGINLYLANQPDSNGMNMGPPPGHYQFQEEYEEVVAIFARQEAEKAAGRPMKFSEIDRYWRGRAFDFWRQQPAAALQLAAKKLVLILARSEIRNITGFDYLRTEWTPALTFAFVGFWFAGPFGLLGIFLAWRTHPASRPLGLLAAAYLLHLVLFIAADRYRMAVIPLLLLFAAYAVFFLIDNLRARNWKGLTVPAAALAALLVLVNVSWYETNPPSDWAKDAWTAGIRYNRLKKYPQAEAEMRKAVKYDSGNGDIWLGLGESLYYQQRFQEAAASFSEGIRCAADPTQLWYNLALCEVALGHVPQAREILTRLVKQDGGYKLARELLRDLDAAPPK